MAIKYKLFVVIRLFHQPASFCLNNSIFLFYICRPYTGLNLFTTIAPLYIKSHPQLE